MATMTSSIRVMENLTATFNKITDRINKTVNAFKAMEQASRAAASVEEFDRTKNKISEITTNINKVASQQKQFTNEIKNTSSAVDSLVNKFQGVAQTIGSVFIGKKVADYIKSSLESMAIQSNAELQLQVTLSNMGAASNAFDQITRKATGIQSKGIFGDEVMIAAAAELSTYMTDVNAVKSMMDTLTNYATGMSNGQVVDAQQMINYATNLGKVTIGAYDAMTKKGFEFSESQKAIIDGTATHAQLVEVLGDSYASMTNDMRKAETIAQVINTSWGNLYETMSNTPMGKITQLSNAFGDIQEQIGIRLSQSVVNLFDTLNKNMPVIENFLMSAANILNPIIETINVIADAVLNVAGRVHNFFESTFPNFESMIGVITGVTVVVFGLGAAFSMLTSPISLVVAAITGVALAINYVINKINDMAGTTISATGVVSGAFMQLYSVIHNIAVRAWDGIATLAEFFVNVWSHPVSSVKVLFSNFVAFVFDLAADITSCWDKVATNIANSMTKSINFVISSWNKIIDVIGEDLAGKIGARKGTLLTQTASITSTFRDMASMARQNAEFMKPENYFSIARFKSIDNAYQKGYEFGVALESKLADTVKSFSSGFITNNDNIASNIADTARNTGELNDQLAAADEDLKYLRDLAERESINKLTTAEIKISMTNNNAINSNLDIDGVINSLTEKLNEQLETHVLSVYNY